jgi:type VI secretion system protein VasD
LSSCSSAPAPIPPPAPAKPIILSVNLKGGKNLNPDLEGRASPLVVRIYQLENIATFNTSDFFALYENDQSLLAKDIKYRDEFEIKPEQNLDKKFELKEGGHYLAVFAAFRDLDHAQWKVFFEIQPTKIDPYLVVLDFTSLTIEK